MGITHVIRGEDHLSNTSKHMELYQAFGDTSTICPHSTDLKEQGSGKMSKREKGALIEEYQEREFIPEAVRNYLCLWVGRLKTTRKSCRSMKSSNYLSFLTSTKITPVLTRKNSLSSTRTMCVRSRWTPLLATVKTILEKAGLAAHAADENKLREILEISQEKTSAFEQLPEYILYFLQEEFPFNEESQQARI